MKRFFFLCCIIFISFAAKAQADVTDTLSPYQKTDKLPQANLVAADGAWYNIYNNNREKPTVIIVYNPDCHHCELEAEEIAKNQEALKQVDFLWVTTNNNKEEALAFAKKFGFDNKPNFKFLHDPNFTLPIFYDVRTTPFVAVYDHNGKMKKIFRQATTSAGIVDALK